MCVCVHLYVFRESIPEEGAPSVCGWDTFHQVEKQTGDFLGRDVVPGRELAHKFSALTDRMNEREGNEVLSGGWLCWGLGRADDGEARMVLSRNASASTQGPGRGWSELLCSQNLDHFAACIPLRKSGVFRGCFFFPFLL